MDRLPDNIADCANLAARAQLTALDALGKANHLDNAPVVGAVGDAIHELVAEVREHHKLLAALVVGDRGCWRDARGLVLGEGLRPVDTTGDRLFRTRLC